MSLATAKWWVLDCGQGWWSCDDCHWVSYSAGSYRHSTIQRLPFLSSCFPQFACSVCSASLKCGNPDGIPSRTTCSESCSSEDSCSQPIAKQACAGFRQTGYCIVSSNGPASPSPAPAKQPAVLEPLPDSPLVSRSWPCPPDVSSRVCRCPK